MSLHQELLYLRDEVALGRHNRTMGICNHLALEPDDRAYFRQLLIMWPESSGLPDAPVKHASLSPSDAYCYVTDLWDTHQAKTEDSDYARRRHELLDWLIGVTSAD